MVHVIRPRNSAFTPAQVTGFYFRPCRDDFDEVIPEYFRCRCGTVRKQTRRNGYSNLMQHVRREHADYERVMLAAPTAEPGSMLSYVRSSALNVYGWLDWIVKNILPLHFCENPAARRYSKLEPICVETLLRAMTGLTRVVERTIATEMPDRFGLIFDGWSHASEHFVAVFARYEVDGVTKTPLLCMAPLLNDLDDDLSARGHFEFLANMLPRDFGKQLTQCLFLVGDNCSVNRLLATLVGVPLIGCASHRLNRALQVDMEDYEDDLAAVQALMVRLRTLKQSAKLRLKTDLRPVIRQDTRWSSTIAMVYRYVQLLEYLDPMDDNIVDVLPPPAANKRLLALLKDLKKIESVSKALQGEDITLLDVRVWFDGLIAIKPHYASYLGTRADIVHSPDFESGCVRVLDRKTSRLTRAEKAVLLPFRCTAVNAEEGSSGSDAESSFVAQLQKRRRLSAVEQRYDLLNIIPPTSNIAERFFTVARTTYGQERHRLQPITLELVLFLRQNSEYWTAHSVDEATR